MTTAIKINGNKSRFQSMGCLSVFEFKPYLYWFNFDAILKVV